MLSTARLAAGARWSLSEAGLKQNSARPVPRAPVAGCVFKEHASITPVDQLIVELSGLVYRASHMVVLAAVRNVTIVDVREQSGRLPRQEDSKSLSTG